MFAALFFALCFHSTVIGFRARDSSSSERVSDRNDDKAVLVFIAGGLLELTARWFARQAARMIVQQEKQTAIAADAVTCTLDSRHARTTQNRLTI